MPLTLKCPQGEQEMQMDGPSHLTNCMPWNVGPNELYWQISLGILD